MLELNKTLIKGGTILIINFNNLFKVLKQGLKGQTP
jgi:hypothetical protein